jgi:hypothetical protein
MVIGPVKNFWRCVLGMPGSLHERASIGSEFSEEQKWRIPNREWRPKLSERTRLKEMSIVRTDTGTLTVPFTTEFAHGEICSPAIYWLPTALLLSFFLTVIPARASSDGPSTNSASTSQGSELIMGPGTQIDAVAIHRKVTDDLKRFLTNPPVIANLIAEVCRANVTNGEMYCYFVQLRYQPNAFLYLEAPRLLDLSSTNTFPDCRFAGYYDHAYWTFSLDGLTLQSVTNGSPSVERALGFVLEQASVLLHLGLFAVKPGDLTVEGDRFASSTNFLGAKMEGNFILAPDSFPKGLEFNVLFSGRSVPWRADYSFDVSQSLPRYIPSRIDVRCLLGGTNSLQYEAHLFTVEFSNDLLPREAFMPDQFTSHTIYLVTPSLNGTWVVSNRFSKQVVAAAPSASQGKPSTTTALTIILALNALVVAAIAATIIKQRRMKNTKNSTMKG